MRGVSHPPNAHINASLSAVSQHAVLLEHLAQQPALLQLLARVVLAQRFFPRLGDDFAGALCRDYNHAVYVAKHDVAAAHGYAAAFHWNVAFHHAGSALGVQRPDSAVENSKVAGARI